MSFKAIYLYNYRNKKEILWIPYKDENNKKKDEEFQKT